MKGHSIAIMLLYYQHDYSFHEQHVNTVLREILENETTFYIYNLFVQELYLF